MISYKFARRSFLRAAGGSTALLLPLLRSIEARAQGVVAPLRFLLIHHPLGTAPGLANWRPNARLAPPSVWALHPLQTRKKSEAAPSLA